MKKSSLESF